MTYHHGGVFIFYVQTYNDHGIRATE